MMITEPGLTRDGRTLLYRARLFERQNGKPYPLALDSDQRGARSAVAGGYVKRKPSDSHFVCVTPRGHAYLDRLMRAE